MGRKEQVKGTIWRDNVRPRRWSLEVIGGGGQSSEGCGRHRSDMGLDGLKVQHAWAAQRWLSPGLLGSLGGSLLQRLWSTTLEKKGRERNGW